MTQKVAITGVMHFEATETDGDSIEMLTDVIQIVGVRKRERERKKRRRLDKGAGMDQSETELLTIQKCI